MFLSMCVIQGSIPFYCAKVSFGSAQHAANSKMGKINNQREVQTQTEMHIGDDDENMYLPVSQLKAVYAIYINTSYASANR